jgi:hypothetical protein
MPVKNACTCYVHNACCTLCTSRPRRCLGSTSSCMCLECMEMRDRFAPEHARAWLCIRVGQPRLQVRCRVRVQTCRAWRPGVMHNARYP